MLRVSRVFLAVLIVLLPGIAASWTAVNRHEVYSLGNGVFEVVGRPGSGAADYWCGAGDYARHQLGTRATQRIYIWEAIGPSQNRPGRKAVQFSLSPPANASTSPGYSLSVKAVDDNLTSATAAQYCTSRVKYVP